MRVGQVNDGNVVGRFGRHVGRVVGRGMVGRSGREAVLGMERVGMEIVGRLGSPGIVWKLLSVNAQWWVFILVLHVQWLVVPLRSPGKGWRWLSR